MRFFAEVNLTHVALLWLWASLACFPWHKVLDNAWLRAMLHFKYAAWLIGVYWLAGLFVHEYLAVVIAGAVTLSVLELAPEKERRTLMPPIQEFLFTDSASPIGKASRRMGARRRAIGGPGADSRSRH